jgi:hypothetical protein
MLKGLAAIRIQAVGESVLVCRDEVETVAAVLKSARGQVELRGVRRSTTTCCFIEPQERGIESK